MFVAAVLSMFSFDLSGLLDGRLLASVGAREVAKSPLARAKANAGDAGGGTQNAPQGVPSLAEIFREHAPFVWRGLRRLGVPEADVEDVCQEVFVVVHRKLGDFEGRSSLRTWIYGIAARTASDYRRSGRVRREVVTDAPPDVAHEAGQHDALALKQARATLDRILDELDDDKRSVFVLYEIEELTMAEVADALGCPLQTAYSRLHAARKVVEAGVARNARSGA
ncbi:MAG: polymerase sigma factor RpoE [Labilithrix sp.]|nr:polymerase sigma factor RpoE [Labilithrix sp.]